MSTKDFYNAVTPGSSFFGVGRGVYTIIDKKDILSEKMYEDEKLPTERDGEISVLNEVRTISIKLYFQIHIST